MTATVRRQAILLVVIVIMAASGGGCAVAATVHFYGTSIVSPVPPLVADIHATGRAVVVRAEDVRPDVAVYEVGSKRSGTYGFEASTIDLRDKRPLADVLSDDVVAILRKLDYRAASEGDASVANPDVRLTVRILAFSVDVIPEAPRMDADALVSFEAVAAGGKRVAVDAVGVRRTAAASTMGTYDDAPYQQLFTAVYSGLRDRLAERLADALPR